MRENAGAERLTFHRNQGCCLMDGVKVITVRVWAAAETHARATLDTGSRLNWMSKDVADRIGAQIESLTDDNHTFQLMDGHMLQPIGKVEATWHKDGGQVSRVTTFLIAPSGSIDMILGAELLFRENVFIFNEYVLPLVDRKLTDDEKRQQQTDIQNQKERSKAAKSKREEAQRTDEGKSQRGDTGAQGKGINAAAK